MNTTNIRRRHLAQELIEEILQTLPVKSLLRFRFVSRSWDSLIRSERFVRTHLENSIANPAFVNHVIFFNNLDKKPGRLFSVSTKEEATVVKRFPMRSFMHALFEELAPNMKHSSRIPTMITVVGSCNGMVCFSKRAMGWCYFYLCNPSTRTSIKLPRIEPWLGFTKCGFGFDEWSGAYKVFVVMSGDSRCLYRVYSSNTNAWRKVEIPNIDWGFSFGAASDRKDEEEGILVSGKLHWPRAESFVFDIITFDLKSEVFETMDLPFDFDGTSDSWFSSNISLGVLNGCLTAVYYHDKQLDVWVMMKYGVKDSWIKMMQVPFPYNCRLSSNVATLCLGPNGEILMIYGSDFLAYDLKKGKLLQFSRFEALSGDEGAHLFVESLVCPKRFLDQHA